MPGFILRNVAPSWQCRKARGGGVRWGSDLGVLWYPTPDAEGFRGPNYGQLKGKSTGSDPLRPKVGCPLLPGASADVKRKPARVPPCCQFFPDIPFPHEQDKSEMKPNNLPYLKVSCVTQV